MAGAEAVNVAKMAVFVLVMLTCRADVPCLPSVTSQCGQLCHTADYGNLTLPTNCGMDGDEYCSLMDCYFEICPLSKPEQIVIAFWNVNLELAHDCLDYVEINGKQFCNMNTPLHNLNVNKLGCVYVAFHSDSHINGKGFSLSYYSYHADKCNILYGDPSSSLTLPTECDGHYCPNMNCYIGICPGPHSGGYVTLTFSLFDVDDSETCSRDVLEIEGTAYCSLDSVPRVFPLDQRGCLNLTFRSDNSHQGRGFRLSYKAGVAASCPAIYMGPSGVVVPPESCLEGTAPSSSCGALDCDVKVCLGPKASHVSLAARQWDLSCPGDFLEVGGRRYCQASPQGEVLALDGRGCLDLLFHWNSSVFRVQLLYSLYNPECGQLYHADDSGIVTLPTACDGVYCNNLLCDYHICPPSDHYGIYLTILLMDLGDNLACQNDYLLLDEECYLPFMFAAASGCFSMSFHSNEKTAGKGFSLLYTASEMNCGTLKYLEDSGSVELLQTCDPEQCNVRQCNYTICPMSRPSHIQVRLAMLMLGKHKCSTDFLDVNGIRRCSFTADPMVIPVDSRGCLAVQFRFSSENKGFRLSYKAVDSFPGRTTSIIPNSTSPGATAHPVSPVTCEPVSSHVTGPTGFSASPPALTSNASSSPTSTSTASFHSTAGLTLLGVQWAGVGFVLCLGVEGLVLAVVCLFRHFRRLPKDDEMVIFNESSL